MDEKVTAQLRSLAAAQRAVAQAMTRVEGIVKGYTAAFDELQRVTVKTPSGGSAKKTAAELEAAGETALWLEKILASLEPKAREVAQGVRDAVDPLRYMRFSGVDAELTALAAKSATVGGAMAGALTVVAGKYHDAVNTLHAATDAYVKKSEERLERFAQYVQGQVIDPLDGGFATLAQSIPEYFAAAIQAAQASMTAVATAVGKMNDLSVTIGGKTVSLTGGKTVKVPGLAQGAVLPANEPFLAVVGDQKRGTNIEAPLATIQEAVAQVMEGYASANLAGQEATVEVLQSILEAVLGISVGDSVIADAYNRHSAKMAVVRGS